VRYQKKNLFGKKESSTTGKQSRLEGINGTLLTGGRKRRDYYLPRGETVTQALGLPPSLKKLINSLLSHPEKRGTYQPIEGERGWSFITTKNLPSSAGGKEDSKKRTHRPCVGKKRDRRLGTTGWGKREFLFTLHKKKKGFNVSSQRQKHNYSREGLRKKGEIAAALRKEGEGQAEFRNRMWLVRGPKKKTRGKR